jgi:mono/diheme cytochrome c family protein
LLAAFFLWTGCGGTQSQPPAASPESDFAVREGGRLFGSFCASCHGEAGRGDGAYLAAGAPATPPDFSVEGVRERMRKDLLMKRLASHESSGEAHCPPWGMTFSPEEIEALATFLEALAAPHDANAG